MKECQLLSKHKYSSPGDFNASVDYHHYSGIAMVRETDKLILIEESYILNIIII
jgi:hypothetical protein